MENRNKPLTPVKPTSMEIIFIYPCPFCGREVPLISPSRPAMAQCDSCRKNFAIVPVDDKAVRFFRVMLDNGRAAVDPDFI